MNVKLEMWLSSLPKADRIRETAIAQENLRRISEFLSGESND